MKISSYTAIFLCMAILVGYCSCKKDSNNWQQSKLLSAGSCTSVNKMELPSICFDSLIVDCRCPADVTCIWEGYAQVKLSINTGMGYKSFFLSTLKTAFLPSTDTVIDGYNIRLINVFPYPVFSIPGNEVAKVELQISR
jgi:hypothetical protein